MTRKEAIAIIRKEYLCVDRDCDIERSCGKCDLMMPTKEPILEAFKMAMNSLEIDERYELEYEQIEPCEDAISRQAVLDELNKWDWQELYLPIHFKENIIDVVPSVNPQEPKTNILDKIIAEIEQLRADLMTSRGVYEHSAYGIDYAMQIINKYKAESEASE